MKLLVVPVLGAVALAVYVGLAMLLGKTIKLTGDVQFGEDWTDDDDEDWTDDPEDDAEAWWDRDQQAYWDSLFAEADLMDDDYQPPVIQWSDEEE